MATGRKAKTKGLGLEEIGVELDEKGGVKVGKAALSLLPLCATPACMDTSTCRRGRQTRTSEKETQLQ